MAARLYIIGIFIISFTASLFIMKGSDYVIANQIIARDTQVLTDKFLYIIDTSIKELNQLPPIDFDSFECSPDVERQLHDVDFNGLFFRWVGVVKNGDVVCQSNNVTRNVASINAQPIGEQYKLGIVEDKVKHNKELIITKSFNGISYVASLIPLEPGFFVPMACKHCLELTITFENDEYLRVDFDTDDQPFMVKKTVSVDTEQIKADFSLAGTRAFY